MQHTLEGLARGMRKLCVGDERILTIHPDWAFGKFGAAKGRIPPYSIVVYKVKVLRVIRHSEWKKGRDGL